MTAQEPTDPAQCDTGSCTIKNIRICGDSARRRLVLIAGPCMAESRELCLQVADKMTAACKSVGVDYVFKASFDKANRTSSSSYRGPGLERGLSWLEEVSKTFDIPVLTDIHEAGQCAEVASVADCLQIPAFLCRQSDLLEAAARTGKCVNIKKGQFMAPWDMGNAVGKVRAAGNNNVLLTERGASFGYNRLITDYRGIIHMRQYAPVCFDATHSVQEPGGLGGASGGERQYAAPLAMAAMAVGADALFIETHPDPDKALSDAASQIALADMPEVIARCKAVFDLVKSFQ